MRSIDSSTSKDLCGDRGGNEYSEEAENMSSQVFGRKSTPSSSSSGVVLKFRSRSVLLRPIPLTLTKAGSERDLLGISIGHDGFDKPRFAGRLTLRLPAGDEDGEGE